MLFVPGGANSFATIEAAQTGRPVQGQGPTVTPAIGSKGSWAQLIAATTNDTFGLIVNINSNNASAASRETVVDIGIGAASSEVVLIPNLICGGAQAYNTGGGGFWYYFPIWIPAGTRIAARAQGTVATAIEVYVRTLQRPRRPEAVKVGTYAEAIGMTLPSGTSVTAGTTSEGTWTSLGTTAKDLWFWQVGVQVSSGDTSWNIAAIHVDLAVGDGSTKDVILDEALVTTSTAEQTCKPIVTLACEAFVPAGSTIYARAQSSGTADPLYITAYGVGG